MASYLFVLNDGPYSNERTYNALRWAGALKKRAGNSVRVYLMGDAVASAVKGQKTPQGFYNVERMLRLLATHGAVAT